LQNIVSASAMQGGRNYVCQLAYIVGVSVPCN